MNDINNNPNRPRLKKIKRPIKRDSAPKVFAEPIYTGDDFDDPDLHNVDLDSLLDGSSSSKNNYSAPVVASQDYIKETGEMPRFINESDITEGDEYFVPSWLTKRNLIIFVFIAFVFGFVFGKVFFAPSQVVRGGLQGVVPNSEVPKGRARCGLTDKTQGCILYLMNPQRQELNGRDFYDLAAQLTGRQRFVIETGNMRYSNVKIRPGEIGQFNIPPL